MCPNDCRSAIKPLEVKLTVEHHIINVFTKLRQGQIASVGYSQLRPRVQLELILALLSILAGFAAINLHAFVHTSRIPNSLQLAERPDPPNRGMPTERRPAGIQGVCAKTEISFNPPMSTYTPWITDSSQLVERPNPPDRGIPPERKPARAWDPCAKTKMPFTPRLPITNTGFS